jgi:pimeloyl-ACP methyl ester carboxylesterase
VWRSIDIAIFGRTHGDLWLNHREKPSRSDPVPQPTTAEDAVADLHALLKAAGEAGSYVLVGHSYGGLAARLYASVHPEEVPGLVLIDALSEGLQDAETPEQWEIQRRLMEGDIRESLVLYPALEKVTNMTLKASISRRRH